MWRGAWTAPPRAFLMYAHSVSAYMTLREGLRRDKGELGHTPVTAAMRPAGAVKARKKGRSPARRTARQADTPEAGTGPCQQPRRGLGRTEAGVRYVPWGCGEGGVTERFG
ncbi:hypothetical protein GCM10018789_35840 [Streptomyces werraensis]|nr:hypothetical protein GCM10018789_35840 [Streptomyces werraensis]